MSHYHSLFTIRHEETTLLTIHFDNPLASAVLGTIHQFESGAHHTDSGPGAPLSQPYLQEKYNRGYVPFKSQ